MFDFDVPLIVPDRVTCFYIAELKNVNHVAF